MHGLQGASMLHALVQHAAGRITILAGGGVTADNVVDLVAATGVKEVHSSAKRCVQCILCIHCSASCHLLHHTLPLAGMHQSYSALAVARRCFSSVEMLLLLPNAQQSRVQVCLGS